MTDTENQERIAVKRERDAFARGRCMSQHEMHEDESAPCTACWQRSVELYPMPKVQRPRVVKFQGGLEYRVSNGAIYECSDGVWIRLQSLAAFPSVITFLADLLANPNEIVDADD